MISHEEFKQHIEKLECVLTYPELDDLHVIEDYVCDLELALDLTKYKTS